MPKTAPTALTLLILTATLLAVSSASAQTDARAHATITIGEVLSLRVEAGGGVSVLSEDGEYRELEGAVTLEVVANRGWRLEAAQEGAPMRTAGSGYLASPERGVWWRIAGADYVPAERWPAPVATGGPGTTTLTLDLRWLAGSGSERAPTDRLHFTLSPDR